MIKFLARIPSTNLRIFVSVVLAVIYVVGTMFAGIIDRELDSGNVITLGAFLLTMMGLDVAQFAVKRSTFIPSQKNPQQPEE